MDFLGYTLNFSHLRDKMSLHTAVASLGESDSAFQINSAWLRGVWLQDAWQGTWLDFIKLEVDNIELAFLRVQRGDQFFSAEGYIHDNVFIPRFGTMKGVNLFGLNTFAWSLRHREGEKR
jgi:hypothetical protein